MDGKGEVVMMMAGQRGHRRLGQAVLMDIEVMPRERLEGLGMRDMDMAVQPGGPDIDVPGRRAGHADAPQSRHQ